MSSVVVIEPWYGGSHRAWLDGWSAHSRHEIATLTLPGEFWRWRMRGAAPVLTRALADHVAEHGRPDVVVVSALMNVAAFCGLARHLLRGVPVAGYFHENQLLYPTAPGRRRDDWAPLANLDSLLAVDEAWFNSRFHLEALFDALPPLLERQPGPIDLEGLPAAKSRSRVLWPGAETGRLIGAERPPPSGPPLVVWNQRWDHDKNPRAVFAALGAAADAGCDFSVALAGENSGHANEVGIARDRLGDRIIHDGWLERDAYLDLLLRSDVVVSAADHEFFGIAIVEAMAAGAVPVLPDRLVFPELVPAELRHAALYPEGRLRTRLVEVLTDLGAARRRLPGLRASTARFDLAAVATQHDDAVDELAARTASPVA